MIIFGSQRDLFFLQVDLSKVIEDRRLKILIVQ